MLVGDDGAEVATQQLGCRRIAEREAPFVAAQPGGQPRRASGIEAEEVRQAIVEIGPRQVAVRVGAADEAIRVVLETRLQRGHAKNVLTEHVERLVGDAEQFALVGPPARAGDGGFQQLRGVGGEHQAALHTARLVAGAANALQEAHHVAGRVDQDNEVHAADVDAEFQARTAYDGAEPAGLEVALDLAPPRRSQRGVVDRDLLVQVGHGATQSPRQLFGQPARVGKNQGCAVTSHVRLDGRDQFREKPSLIRQRLHDHFDFGLVGDGREVATPAVADKEASGVGEGRRRGGKADALEAGAGQFFQAFQAERQVGAALAPRQGVNFIDDDPAQAGEQRAAQRLGQEHGQTFGRRQEDFGGGVAEQAAVLGRRIARPQPDRGPAGAWQDCDQLVEVPVQRAARVAD